MKRFLSLVLILVGAGLLFAGGGGESAGATGAEESGSINLHIFHFKVNIPWNEMTDSYASQHPGIVFTNEIRGGGAQWMTILKSKFAADAAPDIFVVEGPGQAKVFEDFLSDLSDEPWVERAVPFAREGLRLDGQIKGQPINLEGYGYIYNKTYFRDAGVTQVPRTLSELRDAAGKLKAAGYTPFATGYGEWWVVGLHLMNIPFAMQEDPQGFMDDLMAGSATMSGNPRFEDLKNVMDLNVEFGERNPLTTANNEQTQMFISGQAAMMQQGNWKEIVIMGADAGMEVGVFPIPLNDTMDQSNRLPIGVPFYFVLNNESSERTQDAARAFMNWQVASDEGKSWMTEKFGYIPAYGDIEPVGLGGISKDLLTAAAEDRAIPWMFGQFPDGMPQEFAANMQAYVGGQKTWDEVLKEVDAQWRRLK